LASREEMFYIKWNQCNKRKEDRIDVGFAFEKVNNSYKIFFVSICIKLAVISWKIYCFVLMIKIGWFNSA
jgi:hypothetical protein